MLAILALDTQYGARLKGKLLAIDQFLISPFHQTNGSYSTVLSLELCIAYFLFVFFAFLAKSSKNTKSTGVTALLRYLKKKVTSRVVIFSESTE